MIKYIPYYRVSTQKQGDSGLGLESQQESVKRFLGGCQYEIIAEFQEVETGKGISPLDKRPQLKAALEMCRKTGATLLIAKLDRLARNVNFISSLMEEAKLGKGIRFVACDMPTASELTIHIMAAFAEHEARMISARTKEALAMAKKRGVVLGASGRLNIRGANEIRQKQAQEFATKLSGIINGFKAQNFTQVTMMNELNKMEITAPRGGAWTLCQLQRLLKRLK
jgi:DNA invertase Pin-like site-specific DNA recombinase